MENRQLKTISEVPIKGIRKLIANRLGEVWREAVHVTFQKYVDVTPFVARKSEMKYALMDYLLFGLIQTLREEAFSSFNAHFDGQVLRTYSSINLGLATDHPKGLIVPVLHNTDEWELETLSNRRRELIIRAKEWKQTPAELENGTFTISNLGTLGIDYFTPILNPPQTAILGLGRMRMELVSWVADTSPTHKALLPLSLTIDHRILDGADAARFLNRLEERMSVQWEAVG